MALGCQDFLPRMLILSTWRIKITLKGLEPELVQLPVSTSRVISHYPTQVPSKTSSTLLICSAIHLQSCYITEAMVKRVAEEALEDSLVESSPSSKKARVDGFPGSSQTTNDVSPNSTIARTALNGQQSESHKRNGSDSLGAADPKGDVCAEATAPLGLGEDQAYSTISRQAAPLEGYKDLYLDTINRSILDFDFEKLCSVTLSNINVYACLVCGKYYQGRGPRSHAYFHALESGHHVYVNMETKRVYVLPEGYEVKSKSLEDIKFVVDPRLSKEEVSRLDKEAKDAWDFNGRRYRPGADGLSRSWFQELTNAINRLRWYEQH